MRRIWTILALCCAFIAVPATAQRAATGTTMSATDVHAKALAGEVVLVDVRTPDEWNESGVPASAHAITMHQDPALFIAELQKAVGGDRTKKLAIICRSGNRTSAIYADLQKAGFVNLINVAEGVAGGPFGQGWLKTGLPLRAPNQSRAGTQMSTKP
jgi:rhodanese-related sulfurtransferase